MGYQTVSLKEIFIFTIEVFCVTLRASLGVLVVKNLLVNAGDIRDMGSIPGREDPQEEGMATHSSILAWRIPCTEEPGGPRSTRSHRVRHN